jgi:hypothetical protein
MADVISTCSQNDTSGNTSNGGEWYTALSTWEAAAQTRFGTTPNREIVECYNDFGGDLVNPVSIADWGVTTVTDYPLIRPATGQGHGGVYGAGFTLSNTTVQRTLELSQQYAVVEGITVRNAGSASNAQAISLVADDVTVQRCIAFNEATGSSNSRCILSGGNYKNIVIRNCLAINRPTGSVNSGVIVFDAGSTGVIENVTSIGSTGSNGLISNFDNASGIVVTNCAAYEEFGNTTCFKNHNGTNNIANDASANLSGLVTGDFANFAGNDFRPAASGNLDGTGADLSGNFTDDITGGTRDGWDIGAYAESLVTSPVTFDGPDIVAQSGTQDQVFTFDENGEGTVASRFSVT